MVVWKPMTWRASRYWKVVQRGVVFLVLVLVILFIPYVFFWIGALVAPVHSLDVRIPPYTYVIADVRGEPINLVIAGTDVEIEHAFQTMHWEPIMTLRQEGIEAVRGLVNRTTPVSARYVNGRVQDYAYEGPDRSLRHRHHVRLWTARNESMPITYAAASYDTQIGVMFFHNIPLPTHLISPDIDTERDQLGNELARALNETTRYTDSLTPAWYRSNGANSWYYTDGEVLVLTRTTQAPNSLGQVWLALRRFYIHALTRPLKLLRILS